MDYFKDTKAFHDLVQLKQLSTGQIALWYALMYINNKCAWIEWFTVPNMMLEIHTGLSRKGIYNARNILKQYGIIDFKTNDKKATSYKLVSLQHITQDTTQGTTHDTTQGTTQDSATLIKLNNTETNTTTTTISRSEIFKEIVQAFEQNGFGTISSIVGDKLTSLESTYGGQWVLDAIKIAVSNNKRSLSYVEAILKRWSVEGKDGDVKEEKEIIKPPLRLVIRDNY